eukprot:jgi/Mesen1/3164/ME000184S02220
MADTSILLKPYEDRAAKAEERLARIEAALNGLGTGNGAKGPGFGDSDTSKILGSLAELRKSLETAQEEQKQLQFERDEAVKEQGRLATENAKLRYRAQHLIRAVREAEGKKGSEGG